jgi:hypothetical protein
MLLELPPELLCYVAYATDLGWVDVFALLLTCKDICYRLVGAVWRGQWEPWLIGKYMALERFPEADLGRVISMLERGHVAFADTLAMNMGYLGDLMTAGWIPNDKVNSFGPWTLLDPSFTAIATFKTTLRKHFAPSMPASTGALHWLHAVRDGFCPESILSLFINLDYPARAIMYAMDQLPILNLDHEIRAQLTDPSKEMVLRHAFKGRGKWKRRFAKSIIRLAAERDHIGAVRICLDMGARVEDYNYSLLRYAIEERKILLTRLLAARAKDPLPPELVNFIPSLPVEVWADSS